MNVQPMGEHQDHTHLWTTIAVIVLLIAGVALTVFYGGRFLHSFQQVRRVGLRPGETNVELIREWMTVPYIARAYRVPESYLWQGLGIPEQGNRHKDLRRLNTEYAPGRPGEIISEIRGIIQEYQQQPTGTPTSPAQELTPSPPNP